MNRRMEHVKEILGGFAMLLVVLALIGWGVFTGYANGQKVQNMTRLCIEQGYEGWDSSDVSGRSGCVR